MGKYNDIPVEYCEACLDLRINEMEYRNSHTGLYEKVPYCGNCGSGNIEKAHIEDWEELYYDRYGHTYTKGNKHMAGPSGKKGIGGFI